ncbi:response regulator transcription factor [Elusimicrobiota bacterium]
MSESTVHILLIEDNPAEARLAGRILEKAGYTVITATRGRNGILKAQSMLPDLILLDLGLPDVNGFLVMQVLQSDPRTAAIPVLCLTGQPDPAKLFQAAALGLKAADFIRKPFTARKLLGPIARHLRPAIKEGGGGHKAGRQKPAHVLRRGHIVADRFAQKLWSVSKEIPLLGRRQFPLMWALMKREGPVSRLDLLREVWAEDEEPKKVDMVVMRLRRALKAGGAPCRIETTRHGYRFKA